MKERYLIAIGGYGVIDKEYTAQEAEEMRIDKANWEHAPAVKITFEKFLKLPQERVNKHWAYKMIEKHLGSGKIITPSKFIK